MLPKWPIRTKLLIGLGLLLVMVGTISWGGIYGLYAYRGLVRSLSRRVPELPKANRLILSVSNLRVSFSDDTPLVAGADDLDGPAGGVRYGLLESPRGHWNRMAFQTNFELVQENFLRYRQQLEQNPDRGGISDSFKERETVGEIEQALNRIKAAQLQHDWLINEGKIGKLQEDLDELQRLTNELPNYLYDNINEFTVEARNEYRRLLFLSWGTSISAGLLLAVFVKLGYQWVFRPLRVLINGSRKVAAGQFRYRIRLKTDDEMSELADAMNDMTERFEAIRDDLDRQVQERTKEVVRSEQLASVGFLAAGVAHEINNPLASIAMCSESLEDRVRDLLSDDNPEQRVIGNYLRMIQTEAFRCKEITERLLDFSRIGDVKRQNAELGELVQGVIEMIGHLGKYQEKHLEFAPGEPVIVSCNPQEMKQVVLNLLTNALDSLDSRRHGPRTTRPARRRGRTAGDRQRLRHDARSDEAFVRTVFHPAPWGTGDRSRLVHRLPDRCGPRRLDRGPQRRSQLRLAIPRAAAADHESEGEGTSLPSRLNV